MRLLWACILLGAAPCILGANILALLPMPSTSHGILVELLLRKLGERGHSITYITAVNPQKPLTNVKVIYLPDLKPVLFKGSPMDRNGDQGQALLAMRDMSPWMTIFFMPMAGNNLCDHVLGLPPVQEVINSNEKFDLILGEIFLDECMLAGFSHKFKAPIVAVQTFMPGVWANYLVGNPAPAAYIPDPFTGLGSKMTFCERVYNFVYGVVGEIYYTNFYLKQQTAIMHKYFGADYPSANDILKNTSFVLVNHHHSLGFPRPYVPNMVEIAGVHIDKPKPLPKDLQEYMDNSKNGVILFSMGSNLKSADLPTSIKDAILETFSKLKQNVLWKFEAEFPNLPKNVRIMKWLPQSDILAHPNLKLFITHGGLLSTTEAVHRGVPIVGIPIFGDQPLNMKQVENAGFGKSVEIEQITAESFYSVISEVVTNPRYKEAAQKKSELLKDNPMAPMDSSIWWIEYVLRHSGAPQLRSAAQSLTWYQYYLFDVYAIAAVFLITVVAINIAIMKCVFRKIFCKNCKKSEKDAQKKKKQ